MSKGKLRADELFSLEQYARQRGDFRSRVIEHKKARTVAVGPNCTWVFEDRLTIQYQVQEMLRVERIFEPEGIQDELDAYNPLIPDGSNWKATFMIEYEDVEERRAALAAGAGCRGIVCSPNEVRAVRAAVGPDVAIVTPGIRPAGAEMGDQKRAATPGSAIGDGADYLVVGRPIHGAGDRRAAARAIVDEIRVALAAKGA